ncbi:hypothetical protein N7508_007503 [Penicillium antarcticum]|uniref:uncharacterized protein n=1 Tax=Penicillium antarcticum TaxID=416450 RepID=UPI00239FB25D|nr:uncharacterized protein N7508_007503 [Penicillium antarcticum]KAJ5300260.1 hypothetical protein N7508_007503 [Penicillium antarcticum]
MGSVSPQHSCASPKLAKYLERNRIAANKFRERKKKKDKQIERRCSDATKKNEVLLAELSYLREQVCKLKNIVFPHAECADHQNGLQLATMTQIVLDSHRKHDPSTWSTLSSEAWLEESVATDGESYTMIEPSVCEGNDRTALLVFADRVAAPYDPNVYAGSMFDNFIDAENRYA